MTIWTKRTSRKSLKILLCLTGYYRKFEGNYGIISRPLTDMLKEDNFKWTMEATEAFENLKRSMTTALVLRLSDFTKPFTIEADTSGIRIGVASMQEGQQIAFISKALCQTKRSF